MSDESPRPGLIARARAHLRALAEEHASPGRLFAACVVGAIVGCTPFFGLHFFICVGLAMALRLNKVVVYGAANISIPPIAPFLAVSCVEVGSRLIYGHGSLLTASALRAASPWKLAGSVFVAWLVGAPIVGAVIGLAIGGIVYAIARARSHQPDAPFTLAARQVVERFAAAPVGIRQYVTWKLRLDPVYRAIAAVLLELEVVTELGTGLGILPIVLVSLGQAKTVHGVDHDETKIAHGRRAAVGLAIDLEVGDIRAWSIPPSDAVILVDVLHYFDDETQRAILGRAVAALRAGGVLLVREGDGSRRGGASTRLIERIAVALRWNRSDDRPNFRPIAEIVAELEALGCSAEVVPVAGPLHPGNVLVRATRGAW